MRTTSSGKTTGGKVVYQRLVLALRAGEEELSLKDEDKVVASNAGVCRYYCWAYEIVYLPYPRDAGVLQRAQGGLQMAHLPSIGV